MLLKTALNLSCLFAVTATQSIGRRQNISSSDGPVVNLGYAKYRGSRPGTGVDEFLGLRYARPPIGNLRFRAPEDPKSELEVQDATKASSYEKRKCRNEKKKYSN